MKDSLGNELKPGDKVLVSDVSAEHAVNNGISRKLVEDSHPLEGYYTLSANHDFQKIHWEYVVKVDAIDKPEPEINLDDYYTKPIEYTGCDPVIAAALKQGLSIKCKVWNDHGYKVKEPITRYNVGSNYPYGGENGWTHAEPIPKPKKIRRVMGPVEVMQELVNRGCKCDIAGDWRDGISKSLAWVGKSFKYCGRSDQESLEAVPDWAIVEEELPVID